MKVRKLEISQRISCGGGFEGKTRKTILVAIGALAILLLLGTTVSAHDVDAISEKDSADGGGVGTDGGGVGTDISHYDGGGVGTDGGGVGTD